MWERDTWAVARATSRSSKRPPKRASGTTRLENSKRQEERAMKNECGFKDLLMGLFMDTIGKVKHKHQCPDCKVVWEHCYEDFEGEGCLLYTSDAADERSSVDLGGRR